MFNISTGVNTLCTLTRNCLRRSCSLTPARILTRTIVMTHLQTCDSTAVNSARSCLRYGKSTGCGHLAVPLILISTTIVWHHTSANALSVSAPKRPHDYFVHRMDSGYRVVDSPTQLENVVQAGISTFSSLCFDLPTTA